MCLQCIFRHQKSYGGYEKFCFSPLKKDATEKQMQMPCEHNWQNALKMCHSWWKPSLKKAHTKLLRGTAEPSSYRKGNMYQAIQQHNQRKNKLTLCLQSLYKIFATHASEFMKDFHRINTGEKTDYIPKKCVP